MLAKILGLARHQRIFMLLIYRQAVFLRSAVFLVLLNACESPDAVE